MHLTVGIIIMHAYIILPNFLSNKLHLVVMYSHVHTMLE